MTLPQLSPDFDRRSGIGASEVGAALGLSRFVSPYTLWARKVGLEPESQAATAAMEWGLRLQDAILMAYADRMGMDFGVMVRRNSVTKVYGPWPHLFATTDGYAYQHARTLPEPWPNRDLGPMANLARAWCIDAKAPRSSDGWGPDGSSEVPPDYYAQAQAQCLVTGLPRCDFAVLFHGSDFRTYTVMADPVRQAAMVGALKAYWDTFVVPQVAPPIDGYWDSTSATLAAQYAQGGLGELDPTPEVADLVRDAVLAWTNRKQASDAFDLAADRLKRVLGDYDAVTAPAGRVTWPRTKDSTSTAWDQVAQGYRTALDGLLAALPDDILVDYDNLHLTKAGVQAAVDAMEALYTTTKPGTRRFGVKPASSTED